MSRHRMHLCVWPSDVKENPQNLWSEQACDDEKKVSRPPKFDLRIGFYGHGLGNTGRFG